MIVHRQQNQTKLKSESSRKNELYPGEETAVLLHKRANKENKEIMAPAASPAQKTDACWSCTCLPEGAYKTKQAKQNLNKAITE